MSTTLLPIPLALIVAGDNDRKLFDPAKLEQLAASIAAEGLLEHPIVRPLPDGRYELVAGERRFRAVQLLGWSEVEVIVRDIDDAAAATAMLAENFHRVDLDPIEEAGAYRKFIDSFSWSIAEVAERSQTTENRVTSRLRLLDLIPDLQFLVATGSLKISFTSGLPCLDPDRQRQALRAFRDNPAISREQFAQVCSDLFRFQSEQSLFVLENEEFDLSSIKPKARPLGKVGALDLAARLAAALAELDPEHPLVLEAESALAVTEDARSSKASLAARKAHATRRNGRGLSCRGAVEQSGSSAGS